MRNCPLESINYDGQRCEKESRNIVTGRVFQKYQDTDMPLVARGRMDSHEVYHLKGSKKVEKELLVLEMQMVSRKTYVNLPPRKKTGRRKGHYKRICLEENQTAGKSYS